MDDIEGADGTKARKDVKRSGAGMPEDRSEPLSPSVDDNCAGYPLDEPVALLTLGVVRRRVFIWIGAGAVSLGLWIILIYWFRHG